MRIGTSSVRRTTTPVHGWGPAGDEGGHVQCAARGPGHPEPHQSGWHLRGRPRPPQRRCGSSAHASQSTVASSSGGSGGGSCWAAQCSPVKTGPGRFCREPRGGGQQRCAGRGLQAAGSSCEAVSAGPEAGVRGGGAGAPHALLRRLLERFERGAFHPPPHPSPRAATPPDWTLAGTLHQIRIVLCNWSKWRECFKLCCCVAVRRRCSPRSVLRVHGASSAVCLQRSAQQLLPCSGLHEGLLRGGWQVSSWTGVSGPMLRSTVARPHSVECTSRGAWPGGG